MAKLFQNLVTLEPLFTCEIKEGRIIPSTVETDIFWVYISALIITFERGQLKSYEGRIYENMLRVQESTDDNREKKKKRKLRNKSICAHAKSIQLAIDAAM